MGLDTEGSQAQGESLRALTFSVWMTRGTAGPLTEIAEVREGLLQMIESLVWKL